MEENGLTAREDQIFEGGLFFEDGYEAGRRIILGAHLPTLVICHNNTIAYGVSKAFRDAGYRVPDDISIACFDAINQGDMYGTQFTCVMTAQPDEVQGAIAEGAEMLDLHAPVRIETDSSGRVTALWASPKMIGKMERNRPVPADTDLPDVRIPCDIVIVAIGQGIQTHYVEDAGIPIRRGVIQTDTWNGIQNAPDVFAGGDCVTGPATVIRAIAAGKVAANNIDSYLGFHHQITTDIEIPAPNLDDKVYCGRVNMHLAFCSSEVKSTFCRPVA